MARPNKPLLITLAQLLQLPTGVLLFFTGLFLVLWALSGALAVIIIFGILFGMGVGLFATAAPIGKSNATKSRLISLVCNGGLLFLIGGQAALSWSSGANYISLTYAAIGAFNLFALAIWPSSRRYYHP